MKVCEDSSSVLCLPSNVSKWKTDPDIFLEGDSTAQINGDSQQDTPQHNTTPSTIASVPPTRERSDTMMSTVNSIPGPQGQPTMSSMFFVVQALESIQNSKEGKRKGPLKDSTARALGTPLVSGPH